MVFLKYGKSEFPYYGKGMGKHRYSKVVDFLWLRRKSIQILDIRIINFSDHRKGMGKNTWNLSSTVKVNFHITEKKWESANHFTLLGSLRYLG